MIDCSAVSTRQPETGAKISKCSGHFFSPQKSPQNSRPRVADGFIERAPTRLSSATSGVRASDKALT